MKHLYAPAVRDEIVDRIRQLRPDSPRQWGKMTPAQMLAHCSEATRMGLGEVNPPRVFVSYLFGAIAKRSLLREGKRMGRNAPTAPELRISGDPVFEEERARLIALVERFAGNGPERCSRHPHTFFGPLTPEEWAILGYQHLDHHLRQFDA
jgi:hypothetical protein